MPDENLLTDDFKQYAATKLTDSLAQILGALEATVAHAADVIRNLTVTQLATRHSIQGYDVSGQAAVFHAIEHFSLHTGQIVYATKILTGRDLSLYDSDGQRLDGREESVP